ncbi:MAG: efflux RND transporter periplasmic adaptor subunit [Acidobacteria bacterium]|nr:efflux RND transporter periplasmic adaptor subunit [Acidobacteriota bacterium]
MPMFKRMSPRTFAALLGVAMTAVGCSRTPGKAAVPAASSGAPAGPAALDVVTVVEQPLDVKLSLPAELQAFQSVALYARVTGFVKTVSVDRGSKVRAGELLLTLDAPELAAQRAEAESKAQAAQAQVAAVQAKADADRSTFDRLKAASATPGVVAGNDLVLAQKAAESSQHQLASAQQAVEAARQAVSAVRDMEAYLRVTAPFSGVITERNVHPGALVGPGNAGAANPMLRIVENRRLRLVVPVPEAYTNDIREGAEVPFTVAAFPGRTFTGRVARIAEAVDTSTRTMAVELDVTNDNSELSPGTFCQVQWAVRRRGPSLFVPSASVAATTDRTFVIRVRDGKTEWIDVRTGLTSGPLVEVFGDLRAGDQVAGRGTDEVRPGTVVRVREAKPSA